MRLLRFPAAVLAMTVLAVPASAGATTRVTEHLTAGQQLVKGLKDTAAWPAQASINKYDSDDLNTGVTWGTPGLAGGWTNDTRCARLLNELLAHAYPSWATSTWFDQFDSTSPDTATWAAQFVGTSSPTHIDEVGTVAAVLPGDIVLIDRVAGSSSPDHTAVVTEVTPLPTGKTPVDGTVQYAVRVIDSTSSPHGDKMKGSTGWADSRRSEAADGTVTEYNGAGDGWMVLYASSLDGKVYGWRWGVNESALNKISDGHRIVLARVTDEA